MEIFCNIQYKQTQYSKSNDSKQKIDTGAMCDYYDRDEACDKTIDTEDAVNYYKYRIGSNGGWGKNGDFKADEDKKLFEKYKPETIYRMVISFDETFARENKILDKKAMKNLMNKSMNKNIKELGLNPDNVEWVATTIQIQHTPTSMLLSLKKVQQERTTILKKVHLNLSSQTLLEQ